MKTPLLFDLPPQDRPSTEALLTAFCKEHRIWTKRGEGDYPWIAMAWGEISGHFKEKCDGSDAACFELFAGYCGWASDCGLLTEGTSRLNVVRQLAENLDIPCNL